jgi:Rrf2 family protein
MFSKTCEYAIRASIFIAAQSQKGERVSIQDVSSKIESPEAFTSKILQKLVKIGVIQSLKGPGGGFYIENDVIIGKWERNVEYKRKIVEYFW